MSSNPADAGPSSAPDSRFSSKPGRRAFLVGVLGTGLLTGPARAFAPDPRDRLPERVAMIAARLMADHEIPGLMVGLTITGRRQLFPFGHASISPAQAVTNRTIFELGSISKVYTATLAAFAHAAGALRWTDLFRAHLPSLRNSPIGGASLLNLGTYCSLRTRLPMSPEERAPGPGRSNHDGRRRTKYRHCRQKVVRELARRGMSGAT